MTVLTAIFAIIAVVQIAAAFTIIAEDVAATTSLPPARATPRRRPRPHSRGPPSRPRAMPGRRGPEHIRPRPVHPPHDHVLSAHRTPRRPATPKIPPSGTPMM
jgi:hypothetical protein